MPGDSIQVDSTGAIQVDSSGKIIVAGSSDPCCCLGPGECDPLCPIPDALGLSVSFAGVSLCTSFTCNGCTFTWTPGGFTLNGAYCLPALGGQHCVWQMDVSAGTGAWVGGCHPSISGAATVRIRIESQHLGAPPGAWNIEVGLGVAGAAVGKVFINTSNEPTPTDCVLSFANTLGACVCDDVGASSMVGTGGTCTVDLASC